MALHEPRFGGHEWDYVKECIDTGWVSSVGKFVDRFEAELAETCGARHAVAVVNGTAALHVALLLCGVRPGDEVIVPALTFVATANAVSYCGAVPHFSDSEERTLGLDAARLEEHLSQIADTKGPACVNTRTGRRIAAIVPMHVFGHPVDMDALIAVAKRFGLPIVEDAAEALGSSYKGKKLGSLGRFGVLSFNGNKVVTTGGGGAILTNDETLAASAKHITTTGRLAHAWTFEHDMLAYNYRLPNLNAALGVAQLEQLDGFIKAKRRLAERYEASFAKVPGLKFFKEQPFAQSNYWLNAIILDENSADRRDAILAVTNAAGFMTRPAWRTMHHLPMYRDCPKMELTVAESLERRIINLPSSVKLIHAQN
jgi:perosamine synthetase